MEKTPLVAPVFRTRPSVAWWVALLLAFPLLLLIAMLAVFATIEKYAACGAMAGALVFVALLLFIVLPRAYEVSRDGITVVLAFRLLSVSETDELFILEPVIKFGLSLHNRVRIARSGALSVFITPADLAGFLEAVARHRPGLVAVYKGSA